MSNKKSDLEAQDGGASLLSPPRRPGSPNAAPRVDAEYTVSTATKLGYLAVYFLCNVSLTIYNKLVLGKVRFTPPAALSASHHYLAESPLLSCLSRQMRRGRPLT